MTREGMNSIKNAIRNKFAWPGGYPLFLVTDDGAALCVTCGREEFRQICDAVRHDLPNGWNVIAPCINWEDGHLICDHCGDRIQSAYADEEDGESCG